MAGNQGFASMDDKKARKIQSMGGKASGTKSTKSSSTSGRSDTTKRGGSTSHRGSAI